jgi:hypothetical protein
LRDVVVIAGAPARGVPNNSSVLARTLFSYFSYGLTRAALGLGTRRPRFLNEQDQCRSNSLELLL